MVRNEAGIASLSTSITIKSTSRLMLSNFAVFVTTLPVLKFPCTLKQHRIASSPTVLNFDIRCRKLLKDSGSKQKYQVCFTGQCRCCLACHRLFWDLDFTFVKYIQNFYEYWVDIRYCKCDFCKYNMAPSNRFLIWFVLDAIFNPMWGLTARY